MAASGSPKSSFGRILLAGLATAALTAVAASGTWLGAQVTSVGRAQSVDISGSDAAPLALALSLVALAAWGVVLVTGTRARRIAISVGLLATTGVLVALISLWPNTQEVAARVVAEGGVEDLISVGVRPWYWTTGLVALLQVLVFAAAFRAAPGWPRMSSRYDAPGSGSLEADRAVADGEPVADLEIWKALDEGHDPTAGENL